MSGKTRRMEIIEKRFDEDNPVVRFEHDRISKPAVFKSLKDRSFLLFFFLKNSADVGSSTDGVVLGNLLVLETDH